MQPCKLYTYLNRVIFLEHPATRTGVETPRREIPALFHRKFLGPSFSSLGGLLKRQKTEVTECNSRVIFPPWLCPRGPGGARGRAEPFPPFAQHIPRHSAATGEGTCPSPCPRQCQSCQLPCLLTAQSKGSGAARFIDNKYCFKVPRLHPLVGTVLHLHFEILNSNIVINSPHPFH